jgi:hypothetical protein
MPVFKQEMPLLPLHSLFLRIKKRWKGGNAGRIEYNNMKIVKTYVGSTL